MKRIISVFLTIALLIAVVPMSMSVSAANTVPNNAICYVASTKTPTEVYSGMAYTTGDFATDAAALAQALHDYSEKALKNPYTIYFNKDFVFTEQFVVDLPNATTSVYMSLNGHTVSYIPNDNYAHKNESCFIANSDKIKYLNITCSASKDSDPTLSMPQGNTQPFFGGTLSNSNYFLNGSIAGDTVIGPTRIQGTTIYGNVTALGPLYICSTTIFGNVVGASTLTQTPSGTGSHSKIHGNVTISGRAMFQGNSLIIDGDFSCGSGEGYSIKIPVSKFEITINGDLHLNTSHISNSQGNLALIDKSSFTGFVHVGGKTISEYECKTSAPLYNCTFTKGLYVTKDSKGFYTFDDTDKFGSVYYNGDEEYKVVVATYGDKIEVPSDPVKDGCTFLGWADENKELVDMSAETQRENNCYYAKWVEFADKIVTIKNAGEKLPNANLLTADGGKIICFEDSNGNYVNAGSIGTVGETYTAVTVGFAQKLGAAVRINNDGVNGIRFISSVNKQDIESAVQKGFAVESMGTKIGPEEYFSDSSVSSDMFAYAPASGYLTYNSTTNFLAGSIINIKDENLVKNFIGQGYLNIKTPNGDTVKITASLEDNTARSIYSVAGYAYNDPDKYTGEQFDVIKDYLNSVVIIKERMIQTPENYESPYIYTGKKVIPNLEGLITTIDKIKLVILDGVKYYSDNETYPLASIVANSADAGDETEITFIPFKVTSSSGSSTDNAAIYLPATYTDNGTPTRLIIDCHGHGSNAQNFQYKAYAKYFCHQGYAVMTVSGGSAAEYNMGGEQVVDYTIEAYKACMKIYNLYPEVFIKGNSMGGLSSMNVACSGQIPIIAQIYEAPVLSLFRQGYSYGWTSANVKWVTGIYKFSFDKFNSDHGTSYTSSSFPYSSKEKYVSADEIELYNNNFNSAVVPRTNIYKYLSCYDYSNKKLKSGYEDFITATDTARVKEMYESLSIDYPIEHVKVWHATGDGTVRCEYSKYFVDAINRGNGGTAELSTYNSSQHCAVGVDKEVYCKDGSVMTVKSSYIEMWQYIKQYDKVS